MLNQDIVFACEVTLSTRMEEDVLHYNQGARESGTHGGVPASDPHVQAAQTHRIQEQLGWKEVNSFR